MFGISKTKPLSFPHGYFYFPINKEHWKCPYFSKDFSFHDYEAFDFLADELLKGNFLIAVFRHRFSQKITKEEFSPIFQYPIESYNKTDEKDAIKPTYEKVDFTCSSFVFTGFNLRYPKILLKSKFGYIPVICQISFKKSTSRLPTNQESFPPEALGTVSVKKNFDYYVEQYNEAVKDTRDDRKTADSLERSGLTKLGGKQNSIYNSIEIEIDFFYEEYRVKKLFLQNVLKRNLVAEGYFEAHLSVEFFSNEIEIFKKSLDSQKENCVGIIKSVEIRNY